MGKQIMSWLDCKPIDVIAMLIIISGFTAIMLGVDSTVKDMLVIVTAYYFGLKTNQPADSHEIIKAAFQGPQGVQGEQGAVGETGLQGVQGPEGQSK